MIDLTVNLSEVINPKAVSKLGKFYATAQNSFFCMFFYKKRLLYRLIVISIVGINKF
jgi:hypothetical protein